MKMHYGKWNGRVSIFAIVLTLSNARSTSVSGTTAGSGGGFLRLVGLTGAGLGLAARSGFLRLPTFLAGIAGNL